MTAFSVISNGNLNAVGRCLHRVLSVLGDRHTSLAVNLFLGVAESDILNHHRVHNEVGGVLLDSCRVEVRVLRSDHKEEHLYGVEATVRICGEEERSRH